MLYVADSEGSSIRAVPFDSSGSVRTVVGTPELPGGRLFAFGDRDGKGLLRLKGSPLEYRGDVEQTEGPLLQHALGVVYSDGRIYVADTYNNKIKAIDLATAEVTTLAGTGEPGSENEPAQFDEPAGVTLAGGLIFVADTNNHQIRTVEIASGKVAEFRVAGLTPPVIERAEVAPDFSGFTKVTIDKVQITPDDGQATLTVKLELPFGWKLNPLAPLRYWLSSDSEEGPVARSALVSRTIEDPANEFEIPVPVEGRGNEVLQLALSYYFCQVGGEGLCKAGNVVWSVPLQVVEGSDQSTVLLEHQITADAP